VKSIREGAALSFVIIFVIALIRIMFWLSELTSWPIALLIMLSLAGLIMSLPERERK